MTGAGRLIQEQGPDATRPPTVRIDRLVLLAGAVRPSDLTRATRRGVLNLPISAQTTLLGQWCEEALTLCSWAGLARLDVEVVLDPATEAPTTASTDPRIGLHVRRDETSYRGTGGALRDIVESMDDDATILVANAGQILTMGLDAIVGRLHAARADVALVAHADGTPSGVMLLTTRTLRDVNTVGFVDFKEQVLPKLSETHDIRAVSFERATGRPIRTLESYIAALREHHQPRGRDDAGPDPFAERWSPTFGVQEAGAIVDPSARLHDSVVLAGGRVEAGSVVVRSVVGPHAVVAGGEIVVDSVVSASGRRLLGRSA